MRYWERGMAVCGGEYRIGHLVHVSILLTHWSGLPANSICRWYALHSGGRVFLQRKALGLHWYLNPAIFSITCTQPCLYHLCLFDKNLIIKEDPTLHGSWESRRAEVQSPDLIGAMERRKNDVLTEIFSQWQEKPLDRGKKIPCKYSARGLKSRPRISHSADQGNLPSKCFPQGKVVII